MKYILFSIIFTFLFSCGASIKLWNGGDLSPPHLLFIKVLSHNSILLRFDEEIDTTSMEISLSSDVLLVPLESDEHEVIVQSPSSLLPGKEYTLYTHTSDLVGNSLLSINTIYGYNPDIPQLLINEFICEGSKSNPDKVEIIVIEAGNLAGLALQQGGTFTYNNRIKFPTMRVEQGDFIVAHWDPEPLDMIDNETQNKQESTHPQAIETSWDIFSTMEKGISNTNGSLSIVNLVNNDVLDVVIYSVKEDNVIDKYSGFGSSKAWLWSKELYEAGAWNISNREIGIVPSDTVNPKDSTTTRSIGRDSNSKDTDSASDWHITPTRGASFGSTNTDEVYLP